MQNIVILIPSLKKGGAEKQACFLAKALKNRYNISMIVLSPQAGMEQENIQLSELSNDQIYKLNGSLPTKICHIYRILKKIHPEFLFCYLTQPDLLGPIIGKLTGIKYIYQGLRNTQLPPLKIFFEWIGNKFSTGSIINNYSGVGIFKRYGINNIVTIPNCYQSNNNTQSIARKNSDITVITVGRFVDQKDYPSAIASMAEAMKQNNHIRFKIIGHGYLENSIYEMVNSYGISDRTEILINPKGIMQHLLDADIYLSTSLFEGTSNSIMEALDAYLPVVATDVGDNKYLVKNNINGYLHSIGDTNSIANSIQKLSSSKDLRTRFGKEGHRILFEDYSYETFQKRYFDLISSNLNETN